MLSKLFWPTLSLHFLSLDFEMLFAFWLDFLSGHSFENSLSVESESILWMIHILLPCRCEWPMPCILCLGEEVVSKKRETAKREQRSHDQWCQWIKKEIHWRDFARSLEEEQEKKSTQELYSVHFLQQEGKKRSPRRRSWGRTWRRQNKKWEEGFSATKPINAFSFLRKDCMRLEIIMILLLCQLSQVTHEARSILCNCSHQWVHSYHKVKSACL